jgi:RNA ligase (TIGR02306 family)
MERKLASLQKILEIYPHSNADRLEIARVLGWRVIVGKGEFQVGDLCIYCEIDSKFPEEDPLFQRIAPLKGSHFRLKTIRLRGELSQGLCLPLKILEEKGLSIPMEEGLDVTDLLKITKYEVFHPGEEEGEIHPFPHFIPKTNQIRLQSFPQLMQEILGLDAYVMTKYDGTSFTAYYRQGQFGFCRRNAELIPSGLETATNFYEEIVKKLELEKRLRSYQRDIAIQGEICGPKLAKNPLGLKQLDLFLFDIFDIDQARYLALEPFLHAAKDLDLQTVEIQESHFKVLFKTIKEYLEFAKGNYFNTSNPREGIVIRPLEYVFSSTLQNRLTFKVINNDYLEKYNL